jgi:hypothetical protein
MQDSAQVKPVMAPFFAFKKYFSPKRPKTGFSYILNQKVR